MSSPNDLELVQVTQKEFKLVRAICRKDTDQPWDLNPKKVILIGAGAVKNSWAPLLEVLKNSPPLKLTDHQHKEYFEEPSFAAHALANATFMFRAIRNSLIRKTASSTIEDPFFKNGKMMIDSFYDFRSNIAKSFLSHQKSGNIKLRREIEKVKAFISDDTVAVITTNWDELLWSEKSTFVNLVQLHGRASIPESMILPTELTTDDELFRSFDSSAAIKTWTEKGLGEKEELDSFSKRLSRGEMLTHLDQAHHTAVHWLSSAEEVLVWGLNFNIYDAELSSVVSASNDPASPLKKLSVIDIQKSTAEHVARMNLFPTKDVKFIDATEGRCKLFGSSS